MNASLRISVKNLQKIINIDKKEIKRVILGVFENEGVRKNARISVCFAGDKKIRELNVKFLGHDYPTDVIAFSLNDKNDKEIIADIIISAETAAFQSRVFKTSITYELYLYLIHGILHILGYDDKDKKSRALMRSKEKFLCKKLICGGRSQKTNP